MNNLSKFNVYQLVIDRRNIDWNRIVIPPNVLNNNVDKYILILDQYHVDITGSKPGDYFKVVINGSYIGSIIITKNDILYKGEVNDAVLMTIDKRNYSYLRDSYELKAA